MESAVCALFLAGGVNSEGPTFTSRTLPEQHSDSVQVSDAPQGLRGSEASEAVGAGTAPEMVAEFPFLMAYSAEPIDSEIAKPQEAASRSDSFLARHGLPEHPEGARPLGPALAADTQHFTMLSSAFGPAPVDNGYGGENEASRALQFAAPVVLFLCLVCVCCMILKCCCGECLGLGGGYQQPGCYDSTPYGPGSLAMAGAAGLLGGYELQQWMGGGGGGYPMGGGGYPMGGGAYGPVNGGYGGYPAY